MDNDIQAALDKTHEALQSHKQLTGEQLHAIKQELLDAIAASGRTDKESREQLAKELVDVKKYIADQRKADDERAKVKSSSSTIVVPPNDTAIAPQAPPASDGKKTSKLSRWW